MKRFLSKLLLLFLILVCIDMVAGVVFDYIYQNAKGGMVMRDNFICNKLHTDILLCGSSRCVHHYNPQIITDSLGLSCYNSGQDGNGILLSYGRLLLSKRQMSPKLVIYDINPSYDLLAGDDNHKYLQWLKSHYDQDYIKDIFESVDKTERYKMVSNMYRHNSRFIETLVDFFHPVLKPKDNGFLPHTGDMDKSKIKENSNLENVYYFDSLKIAYLEKYIDAVDGQIVFSVSPIWYGMDSLQFKPIKEICKRSGVKFIDFSNNPKYVHNDIFFKDGNHMNERGANEFTRDFIKELRKSAIVN